MKYTAITNGIYVRVADGKSLLAEYLDKQKSCTHQKRDPRGTCYECGHRESKG